MPSTAKNRDPASESGRLQPTGENSLSESGFRPKMNQLRKWGGAWEHGLTGAGSQPACDRLIVGASTPINRVEWRVHAALRDFA